MNKTKIDWADYTWNPVTGCLHGCPYCYARKITRRFSNWGFGIEGRPVSELIHALDQPYDKFGKVEPYPFGFEPTSHRYRLDEPAQKTKGRTIFVCSMADLFGKWVPDSWIQEVFAACERAPQHRYLFLTKNPQRYTRYGVPMAVNLWYGTTITGDMDAGRFNYLPAHCNTFVSIEPIHDGEIAKRHNILFHQVSWVIIGAETGNRKDKVIPEREWIQDIADQCRAAGVPIFMKESLRKLMGAGFVQEFPWEVQG